MTTESTNPASQNSGESSSRQSAAPTNPDQADATSTQTKKLRRRRGNRVGSTVLAQGEPMLWLTGGGLVTCLLMVIGLLLFVFWQGVTTFWPSSVVRIETVDGEVFMGESTQKDTFRLNYGTLSVLTGKAKEKASRILHPKLHARLTDLLASTDREVQLQDAQTRAEAQLLNVLNLAKPVIESTNEVRSGLVAKLGQKLDEKRDNFSGQFLKQVEELTNTPNETVKGTAIYEAWVKAAGDQDVALAQPNIDSLTAMLVDDDKVLYNAWSAQLLSRLTSSVFVERSRELIRTGNFDVTGTHFKWISDFEVAEEADRVFSVSKKIGFVPADGASRIKLVVATRLDEGTEVTVSVTAGTLEATDINEDLFGTQLKVADGQLSFELVAPTSSATPTISLSTTGEEPVNGSIVDPSVLSFVPVVDGAEQKPILIDVEQRNPNRQAARGDSSDQGRLAKTKQQAARGDSSDQSGLAKTKQQAAPRWALIFERLEWGRFYGIPKALLEGSPDPNAPDSEQLIYKPVATNPEDIWSRFQQLHVRVRNRWKVVDGMKSHEIGTVNRKIEGSRLALREAELAYGKDSAEYQNEQQRHQADAKKFDAEFLEVQSRIRELEAENEKYKLLVTTAQGQEVELALADIVRVYPANQVQTGDKWGIYLSRWGEFLTQDPREANSEGGVWPAIFGTIAMTMLMALAVVPFGILAALYLREYAKAGPLVSAVRIAVNNLAGVPSIVFGVFGMGFFCYIIGAYIDGGPEQAGIAVWPPARWFVMAAVTVTIGIGAFFAGIIALKDNSNSSVRAWISRLSLLLWIAATVLFIMLIMKTPHFHGFYRAKLPNPTYGTGGLMWASFTLALLTLPVVIVATEEALAAVPRSMREGSLACGATKWQTIRRIVLPRALPGIMTGTILAMARGAGEVAPLMMVGAVKLAPHLPIDIHDWSGSLGSIPTGPVHAERSFMHLGFHIYDLGFQSANSEAAKPMVFTTTLILIALIAVMNVIAIWLRARLKKKYQFSQF